VPTAVIVLIVVVAAGALFGLAWWSSGRSKGGYRGSTEHEIAKGLGTSQGTSNNPPGLNGHGH
jgi:hypothetical protein